MRSAQRYPGHRARRRHDRRRDDVGAGLPAGLHRAGVVRLRHRGQSPSGLGRDGESTPRRAAREAVTSARASMTGRTDAVHRHARSSASSTRSRSSRRLRAELGPGVPVLGGGAAPRDPVERSGGNAEPAVRRRRGDRGRRRHPPVLGSARLLVRRRDRLARRRPAGDRDERSSDGRVSRDRRPAGDRVLRALHRYRDWQCRRSATRWPSSTTPDRRAFYLRTATEPGPGDGRRRVLRVRARGGDHPVHRRRRRGDRRRRASLDRATRSQGSRRAGPRRRPRCSRA